MSSRTKERAPGAGGNQPEGDNQKPAQDSVWSKRTRHARARASRRGTVAADPRIAIIDAPDREATVHERLTSQRSPLSPLRLSPETSGLPLVVVDTVRGNRAHVWRTADGAWWRKGGFIQIKKHEQHGRAFVVTLFKGANAEDMRFLLHIIADARRGLGLGIWDRVHAPWADDNTFQFDSSRPYGDPYTNADSSSRARACVDPLCMHQWHDGEQLHELEHAEGNGYSITVSRFGAEKDWHVDVDANGCEFTPAQVSDFVNDLQWMRTECEKANAKGVASRAPLDETRSVHRTDEVEEHRPVEARELRRPRAVDERIREQE